MHEEVAGFDLRLLDPLAVLWLLFGGIVVKGGSFSLGGIVVMSSACGFWVLLIFAGVIIGPCRSDDRPAGNPTTVSARKLDALLQDYAYRAFVRPHTGTVYAAKVPANISGVKVSVVRLRSGSLRTRGVRNFNEFDVPTGVLASPYVVRLALVYQNLGNWSSVYYSLPGYTFLSPVIGLLAYNAANLSATDLPELDILASLKPISIKFSSGSLLSGDRVGLCVRFSLNGSYEMADLVSGNLCTTYRQGHFTVATKALPIEEPKKGKFKVWKIVVIAIGSFLGLILLALLILLLRRYRWKKNMKYMVGRSESGEVLKAQRIGNAQLPVASMIRTRPSLENEYAP